MLLSLQRRQQQEEAKARKDIEAMQRRQKDEEMKEERERKLAEQGKLNIEKLIFSLNFNCMICLFEKNIIGKHKII